MEEMIKGAEFSPCKRYRYTLTRIWDPAKPLINWIALNPSTADAVSDDPTIRREIGFSKAWGLGGMVKTNIFAWRSTDPHILAAIADPVGEKNDWWIREVAGRAAIVVVAWGNWGAVNGRGTWVFHKLLAGRPVYCLGVNANGHPKHPLYLRADAVLQEFKWKRF